MMSIADKLVAISENVSKVYEAGKASMVDESKLVPQNVSGAYISLDDVSEIPHKIECKVSSGSVAPETVQVIKFGKNLVPYPFKVDAAGGYFDTKGEQVNAGITATDLGDGGVLLNGRATAKAYIHLHRTNIGNRYISGELGKNGRFFANKYNDNIWVEHHDTNHKTYIVINPGTTCENVNFYPQIEVGAEKTEFEKGIPYEVFTPSADGMVEGMTSASPYMNLFCNTADATLDVTYNKSYGMYKCEQAHEAIKEEGISEGKQAEYDRFWDGVQDYGKRYSYNYGFTRWNTDGIFPKYDIKPTGSMANMFVSVVGEEIDLTERFNECGIEFDTSGATNMQYAFYSSLITRIPKIDTSGLAAITYIAPSCLGLVTVDELKLRDDGSQTFTDLFPWSTNLTNLTVTGTIGQNGFDVSSNSKLTHDSLMSIIKALQDKTTDTSGTTWTVSIGSTNKNKLTEEELLIARNRGWTVN